MKTISIETKEKQYFVHIGMNIFFNTLKQYAEQLKMADQIVILVDEKVAKLHMNQLLIPLQSIVKANIHVYHVPEGEACKTVESYFNCHSFLLQKGCTRKSVLFAFGGGACGDLTGFVASTFMRGVPFYQFPTTILAHDSAVGGKTAINHPQGKNMIGSFYQPEAVIYDISLLKTLPFHEVRSGMAEVIKHALISDEQWLNELLSITKLSNLSEQELMHHLVKGIQVKANIVKQDEFETSIRKYLNLGHTYGHAIETSTGYGKITHGEAVAIGLIYALILSEQFGNLSSGFAKKCFDYMTQIGFSFDHVTKHSYEDIFTLMMRDKKVTYGDIHFVLLNKVGEPFMKVISSEVGNKADQQLRNWVKEVHL
ncbi:MAG: 3-dehydroquinate synthase [Paenisporosarcina sp.]